MTDAIAQATLFLTDRSAPRPNSKDLVAALLAAEKATRQTKTRYHDEQLIGSWRLGFITGTQSSRRQAGVVLGAGRFLPTWLTISLTYTSQATNQPDSGTVSPTSEVSQQPHLADRLPPPAPDLDDNPVNAVTNTVTLGLLTLMLTGPARLWPQTNLLGFDFIHLTVTLAGLSLYSGGIRGGSQKQQDFQEQSIKQQAFFNYFLVTPNAIAARGRGGGLALWVRVSNRI